MQPLDYSSLDTRITFSDRIAAMRQTGQGQTVTTMSVATALAVAVLAIALPLTRFDPMVIVTVFFVLLIPGIFFGMAYGEIANYIRVARMASSNNLEAVYGEVSEGVYSGMIFNRGHSQSIKGFLRFPNISTGLREFGNYHYAEGYGRNQRNYNYGVIRIKLPRNVPHMVLDAQANNSIFKMTNLPESFRRDERLSLEGDFDKHFTLYAPATYKTDALYIFTPDVMQALIDCATQFDVEVIDSDLYLYSSQPFNLADHNVYELCLSIATIITPQIDKQAGNYHDDAVGNRALDWVADPGRRLKTRVSTASILVCVALILYYGMQILTTLRH